MTRPQDHINALDAQLLLQKAMGENEMPGLREALLANTPVPAQLPADTLTDEVFTQTFVLPWLAERLRAGETLSDIRPDYQDCYAGVFDWWTADQLHPMIALGHLALEESRLREVLRYNDDALCAVVAVRIAIDEHDFMGYYLYETSLPCTQTTVAELRLVAAYLATLGPTLCTRHLSLDQVIVLEPVIWYLRMIARDLEQSFSRTSP